MDEALNSYVTTRIDAEQNRKNMKNKNTSSMPNLKKKIPKK